MILRSFASTASIPTGVALLNLLRHGFLHLRFREFLRLFRPANGCLLDHNRVCLLDDVKLFLDLCLFFGGSLLAVADPLQKIEGDRLCGRVQLLHRRQH